MTDQRIIELFWDRNELAINETQTKYGHFCYSIAFNILRNKPDAEECENDTYLSVWNTIPPDRPMCFSAFLGKITRNLSLKRLRSCKTQKRGGNEALLSLDELLECIPDHRSFDEMINERYLTELLNAFLRALPDNERRVFICRYWYCESVKEIAQEFGFGESKVKMMLLRTRQKLLTYLTEKGVFV